MLELNNEPILFNNTNFFKTNIATLYKLRPKVDLSIRTYENGTSVIINSSRSKSKKGFDAKKYFENFNKLRAVNTSIILNCFSLFEASFEWCLLRELNTKDLSGIQEKIMLRYIEDILRLSSQSNFLKEFKFITGKKLKEYLSETEFEQYKIIIAFYPFRHLLVHGSSSNKIILGQRFSNQIVLDQTKLPYPELIKTLNAHLKLKLPLSVSDIDSLLIINNVTDLLSKAISIVSTKLIENNKSGIQSIKGINFKSP